jgi:hypothetical protein
MRSRSHIEIVVGQSVNPQPVRALQTSASQSTRRMATYILREQIRRPIVILEQAHVTTLEAQWPERPAILKVRTDDCITGSNLHIIILPTNTLPNRNSSLSLFIGTIIDMHPHHVFARGLVVKHLGPLDNPVGSEITATLPREQFSYICPFHQILLALIVVRGLGS